MKYNPTTVQMIFDDAGTPLRFFYLGAGKFSLYDCVASKEEGVGEFLREALQEKQPVATVTEQSV